MCKFVWTYKLWFYIPILHDSLNFSRKLSYFLKQDVFGIFILWYISKIEIDTWQLSKKYPATSYCSYVHVSWVFILRSSLPSLWWNGTLSCPFCGIRNDTILAQWFLRKGLSLSRKGNNFRKHQSEIFTGYTGFFTSTMSLAGYRISESCNISGWFSNSCPMVLARNRYLTRELALFVPGSRVQKLLKL